MIKKFTAGLFLVAILALSGCSKIEKTENGVKTTDNKIVTDDVSYIEKDSEITIHRNKITKTATIDITYKIKNEDEYSDFLGTKVTMVPMLFNLTCSALTTGIFQPEQTAQATSTDGTKVDEKMKNYLTGYTPKKLSLNFIDAEDNQNIASCESEQAGNQNIKVNITRDYKDVGSFMGVKIGNFNAEK
jgi:hypothetical protein